MTFEQLRNVGLASDVGRSNLLVNGGFEIWQRGNGPFTANFAADRWAVSLDTGDTLSVSRDTANVDTGSAACAACTFTRGSGSLSAFVQKVELAGQLAGRTITLSARIKTSAANAVRLSIQTAQNQSPSGSTFTYSPYHPGGGVYQTLSVTTTLAGNETLLFVNVPNFTASCTAYVDNAMLVVGSQPADYQPMHPADDLARCLRYYERFGGNTMYFPGVVSAYASGAGVNFASNVFFSVKKAVMPTVTVVGTFSVGNTNQPAVGSFDTNGGAIQCTSLAAGATTFYINGTSNFIVAESNP